MVQLAKEIRYIRIRMIPLTSGVENYANSVLAAPKFGLSILLGIYSSQLDVMLLGTNLYIMAI
jgi:hypothetical protein